MPSEPAPGYRGRFAPSPTGPLHFGSLVAAVASYLQARANNGEWLVRIEDIDPPRESPGATDTILKSLDAHGFEYPAPLHQSTRLEAYADLTQQLLDAGLAYRCTCSRKQLETTARRGRTGFIYPGTCRTKDCQGQKLSVRVRTDDSETSFEDYLQGPQACRLESEVGDYLVRRGDGLVAYQLAVVADDHSQGITEVVRGTDLLDVTCMQVHLQTALGFSHPKYFHFPVVIGANGSKLSKQYGAQAINDKTPAENLLGALSSLKLNPENRLKTARLGDIWAWASENWEPADLRGLATLPDPSMMVQ